MTDGIFNSLLLLSIFDLAEVSDSTYFSLYVIDSYLFLSAREHFAFGFGVLDTAFRLLSLSFSHLEVCTV